VFRSAHIGRTYAFYAQNVFGWQRLNNLYSTFLPPVVNEDELFCNFTYDRQCKYPITHSFQLRNDLLYEQL